MGHNHQRIGRAAGYSIRLYETDISESSQIIRKRRVILLSFPDLRMYLITMWKLICSIAVSFGP
jgi:hypothetical protein